MFETECIPFQGKLTPHGYGCIRNKMAHRLTYEYAKGPIPQTWVIDHMCRNRACVNPEHLRAVPRRVNGLENSVSPLAINASRTHCPSGHPYDYENTSIVVRNGKEGRVCRKCRSIVANEIHYRSRGKRHLLVQHVAFHLHEYARKPWRVEPDIMVEAQKLAAKIEKLRAKRRSKDHYVRMAALSAAKRLKCHEA